MIHPDAAGSNSSDQSTAQAPPDCHHPQSLLTNSINMIQPQIPAHMLPLLQRNQDLTLPFLPNSSVGLSGLQMQHPAANFQLGGQYIGSGPSALSASLLSRQVLAAGARPQMMGHFGAALSTLPTLSPVPATLSQLDHGLAALLAQSSAPSPRGSMSASNKHVENAIATIVAAQGSPLPEDPEEHEPGKLRPDGSHPPVVVYMDCDGESLSDYQCLLRKQVELFEATSDDVQWNAQGRNKAIVLGQVGIRCRYCARLPTWSRSRGAVYYSATLDGLYQAAQNMAKNHLCRHCRLIPDDVRRKLIGLRDCKKRAAGGKKYWSEGARVLGVYQDVEGLRFKNSQTGRKKVEVLE